MADLSMSMFVNKEDYWKARAEEAETKLFLAQSALRSAETFITNGVEMGFIRMPLGPDPATLTLPTIRVALSKIRGKDHA